MTPFSPPPSSHIAPKVPINFLKLFKFSISSVNKTRKSEVLYYTKLFHRIIFSVGVDVFIKNIRIICLSFLGLFFCIHFLYFKSYLFAWKVEWENQI